MAMSCASGCLRPVGFPWQDGAATGTTTGDGDTTTTSTSSGTTATTAAPTTGDATTSTSSDPATSTTSSSTTTSSTSSPAPVCGDGVVDPGEECDDGDDDDGDGCTGQCGRDRLVFVTGAVYSGDQIGGLAGGDTLCRDAAESAGLPRPLAFRAWLSDRTHDARDRITPGQGRYVRVDGLVVADSWQGLLDGMLDNPIVLTATGEVYESGVWTGTRPDGTRGVGADHCQDWTVADAFDPLNGGYYGFASEFDGLWTFVSDDKISPGPCGGELALYCVEE